MTVHTLTKRTGLLPIRRLFTRRALVKAPPARPIAHPFTHEEVRTPGTPVTRCPACELREYLEG
jgi:hypothetical protein